MRRFFLSVLLLLASTSAQGGEIIGQALDLQGKAIPNVTVQVLGPGGVAITEQTFAAGNYSLAFADTAVPNFSQGVSVLISAPGRESVILNLHGRSINTANVVLPVRAQHIKCPHCKSHGHRHKHRRGHH